jgi:hypothetical protein
MKVRISVPLAALLLAVGCVQGTAFAPERAARIAEPVQAGLGWLLGVDPEDDELDDEEDEDGFWPALPQR